MICNVNGNICVEKENHACYDEYRSYEKKKSRDF